MFGIVIFFIPSCSDETPSTTQVQFCDQYAQALCSEVSAACLFPINGCIANRANECFAQASTAAALGQSYVATKADLCLNKVTEVYSKLRKGAVALKPTDLESVISTCKQVYQGNRRQNESCVEDADCLEGLICDKGRCGTSVLLAPGSGCANIGERCTEGYFCGPTDGVLACISKVGVNSACNTDVPCLESLRCHDGLCVSRLLIGEPCLFHHDCASNFCEPYAVKCANDVRFANGSAACLALQ
jgi:hypothetical protein